MEQPIKSILKNYISILFFIIIINITNDLIAQVVNLKPDSSTVFSDTTLSNFQNQQLMYQRFLRMKYFALDSLARNGFFVQPPDLHFLLQGPAFGLLDLDLPIYTQLYEPFWMKDHRLRASGGYEQIMLNPTYLNAQINNKQDWERSKKEFNKKIIPSNLQLNVLSTIWKQKSSIQLDVYAEIDTNYSITAEGLDYQLERMVKLGFVERKQISPQNLFTILTPFQSYQIEMSLKNRKNRVYLYRSRVDKKEILQIILSRLYRIKNDKVGRPGELKRLNEKLKIVMSEDQG